MQYKQSNKHRRPLQDLCNLDSYILYSLILTFLLIAAYLPNKRGSEQCTSHGPDPVDPVICPVICHCCWSKSTCWVHACSRDCSSKLKKCLHSVQHIRSYQVIQYQLSVSHIFIVTCVFIFSFLLERGLICFLYLLPHFMLFNSDQFQTSEKGEIIQLTVLFKIHPRMAKKRKKTHLNLVFAQICSI